jgi:hypothetical protein
MPERVAALYPFAILSASSPRHRGGIGQIKAASKKKAVIVRILEL